MQLRDQEEPKNDLCKIHISFDLYNEFSYCILVFINFLYELSNFLTIFLTEITTRLPFHDVLTLLCALFASGLNTTHVAGKLAF